MLHEWETQESRVGQKQEVRLYYKQELGLGVKNFHDLEDMEVAWHDDVKVGSVHGLHPSLSMKPKFWNLRIWMEVTAWPGTSQKFVSKVTGVLQDVTPENAVNIWVTNGIS